MQSSSNGVVPFKYDNKIIRTILVKDEVLFIAPDVCEVLGIKNSRDAVKRLDPDETMVSAIPTPSRGKQSVQCVTESGLYHLVFTSTRPNAKAFRRWVTSEVLPALRKDGHYEMPTKPLPEWKQPDGTWKTTPPPAVDSKGQTMLWPVLPSAKVEMQSLLIDVSLQAKPGSKLAQFIRLVKPLVLGSGSEKATRP